MHSKSIDISDQLLYNLVYIVKFMKLRQKNTDKRGEENETNY